MAFFDPSSTSGQEPPVSPGNEAEEENRDGDSDDEEVKVVLEDEVTTEEPQEVEEGESATEKKESNVDEDDLSAHPVPSAYAPTLSRSNSQRSNTPTTTTTMSRGAFSTLSRQTLSRAFSSSSSSANPSLLGPYILENPTGAYHLAQFLENQKQDLEKALAWYAISAKGGYVPGMIVLGKWLSEGKGTDGGVKNEGLAMKWLQRAYVESKKGGTAASAGTGPGASGNNGGGVVGSVVVGGEGMGGGGVGSGSWVAEAAEGIGRLFVFGYTPDEDPNNHTSIVSNTASDAKNNNEGPDSSTEATTTKTEEGQEEGAASPTLDVPAEIDWIHLTDEEAASYTRIPQNFKLAAQYLRIAARKNHKGAQELLSTLSEVGPHVRFLEAVEAGVKKGKWKTCVESLRELAEEGFDEASAYIDPITTLLESAVGCRWFGVSDLVASKQERKENPINTANNGSSSPYENNGKEAGKNETGSSSSLSQADILEIRAAQWFALGASKGDVPCMVHYASLCLEGSIGVPAPLTSVTSPETLVKGTLEPVPGLAMYWYQKAWKMGSVKESAEGIGMLYLNGVVNESEGNDDAEDNGSEAGGSRANSMDIARDSMDSSNPISPPMSPMSPTSPTIPTLNSKRSTKALKLVKRVMSKKSTGGDKIHWSSLTPTQASTTVVYQNLSLASKFLSHAAFKGSLKAEAVLGALLVSGGPGVKPDIDQGMYHLNRAAKGGDPWGMRKFGEALKKGFGTAKMRGEEVGDVWIERSLRAVDVDVEALLEAMGGNSTSSSNVNNNNNNATTDNNNTAESGEKNEEEVKVEGEGSAAPQEKTESGLKRSNTTTSIKKVAFADADANQEDEKKDGAVRATPQPVAAPDMSAAAKSAVPYPQLGSTDKLEIPDSASTGCCIIS
jgi:TPR repeat protein